MRCRPVLVDPRKSGRQFSESLGFARTTARTAPVKAIRSTATTTSKILIAKGVTTIAAIATPTEQSARKIAAREKYEFGPTEILDIGRSCPPGKNLVNNPAAPRLRQAAPNLRTFRKRCRLTRGREVARFPQDDRLSDGLRSSPFVLQQGVLIAVDPSQLGVPGILDPVLLAPHAVLFKDAG